MVHFGKKGGKRTTKYSEGLWLGVILWEGQKILERKIFKVKLTDFNCTSMTMTKATYHQTSFAPLSLLYGNVVKRQSYYNKIFIVRRWVVQKGTGA